jgi:MOSC domain-containing protein YiiM
MDPVSEARLVAGSGIEGNTDRSGRRQVTLLDSAAWSAATAELGVTLDPGTRRANLLLEGVDLFRSRGRALAIGECRLLVRGETKPCERMDEAAPGLEDRLWNDWRGGAFAEVRVGGSIPVGDPLRWVAEDEE